MESSFHYPFKKKYAMFAYVMRFGKLNEKSVLKIGLIFTMLVCIYASMAHGIVLEDLVKDGKLESTLSQKKIGYYLDHEAVRQNKSFPLSSFERGLYAF